jgi:hypothetical protein
MCGSFLRLKQSCYDRRTGLARRLSVVGVSVSRLHTQPKLSLWCEIYNFRTKTVLKTENPLTIQNTSARDLIAIDFGLTWESALDDRRIPVFPEPGLPIIRATGARCIM